MPTTVAVGSAQAIVLQSVGLFSANMQRLTTLNRLSGSMPQQSDANQGLRNQSSSHMPIVRVTDLTKRAGHEVDFDLINPMGGKPIMGANNAEGKGRAMSFSSDTLRINQARYPVSAGDTMSQQRTEHDLRKLARSAAQGYMDRLSDQLLLVHMAGARGFHDNIEWCVPLAADADFATICINTVQAPTKNRHWMSTGSGLERVTGSGNEISIATTDVLNMDVVDAIRTVVDSMPLPPPPVIFDGDEMGTDSPLRVLLVSSEQYTSFVQSTNFRTLQANAMARSSSAGGNPLFKGEAGLWNGILIVKMPKPIRFYAGNSLRYCASYTTETETSTDLVPAAFGTTYAVDRAILLGGQALAEAFGSHRKSGAPMYWSEKWLDHDDKFEVSVAAITGKSKIRFLVDHGGSLGEQYTDYGVMCIDTAVKITAGNS